MFEPVDATASLGGRGLELWKSLGQELASPAGQVALEVCRVADRLTELDSIIAGKGVLDLMRFRLNPSWWDDDGDEHVHVTVSFQSVLGEARQQQLAMKSLLLDLGKIPGSAATGPPVPAAPSSPLDELERRRGKKSS